MAARQPRRRIVDGVLAAAAGSRLCHRSCVPLRKANISQHHQHIECDLATTKAAAWLNSECNELIGRSRPSLEWIQLSLAVVKHNRLRHGEFTQSFEPFFAAMTAPLESSKRQFNAAASAESVDIDLSSTDRLR